MFGDLLGNVQQQQEEMKHKLALIEVEAEAGGGAVKVRASANRILLDISIDKEKLEWDDVEQVQDLVLAAVNRALELAAEKEKEEAQNLLQQMMPPGMGSLSGLFD